MEGRSLLSSNHSDSVDDSEHNNENKGDDNENENLDKGTKEKMYHIEIMKAAFLKSIDKMTEMIQTIDQDDGDQIRENGRQSSNDQNGNSLPSTIGPPSSDSAPTSTSSPGDAETIENKIKGRKIGIMKSLFLNSIQSLKEKFQSTTKPLKKFNPLSTENPLQDPETPAGNQKCSSENILLWKNIGKWANPVTKDLRLLHNVSGRVKAGEIVAVMGHSGCGKSTLLNLLSGHFSKGMEGSIYLNDEHLTRALRRKIAYVTQADIFYENLTVYEHLLYSALLYLSGSYSREEIIQCVDKVLSDLHIDYIKQYQLKVLSGGQRKRCSIGAYLVSKPEFLLLDEPMSGLDSSAMSSLLASLRVQTEANVAVLMTIHQPSTSVFYSFDWLLFLAGRGRVVYWGKPDELMPYLAYYHFFPVYGPNSNPADFLMDLVCNTVYCYDGRTAFQFLVDTWDESAPQPTDALTPADLVNPTTEVHYTTSFETQVRILMGRAWRLSKATIFSSWKIFEGIVLAIITGLLWFQTPYEESSIGDKGGYFFFLIASFFYASVFSSVVNFPMERPVYIKETRAAQFSPSAYYVAISFVESPARLFLPLCYITMSFCLVGVNPNPLSIFGLISTLCISGLVGESLGLVIGLMILDLQHSLVVANLSCITLMLLGGFYTQSLPWFVDWIKYISPFYYTYQLLLQNDFNRPVPCVNGLFIPSCLAYDSYYRVYYVRDELSKEELWEFLGLNRPIAINFLIMITFFILLKVLAYFALVHRRHNKTTE